MNILSVLRRAAIALLSLSFATSTFAEQRETMYVDAGKVYTAAGEEFVMRGYNEMFVWSQDKTGENFIPQMNKSGANTLRLVWDLNFDKALLNTLILNTLEHKMVAIPECHNATGKWDADLQACVDFWNDDELKAVIEGNKRWTILNIANEAGGHGVTDEMFIEDYKKAISDIRSWGYTVPIMIDAAIWGQDVDQLLRVGPTLLAHDPLKNVIFSTHSYWPKEKAIENYRKLGQARELGIAMILGEGPSVTRMGQCEDPNPLPYLEGMQVLEEDKVGWLNWSWGGFKNGDCDQFRYFDITVDGEFGKWWHIHGANIVALSPDSVMQTSDRPESWYENGKVSTSGIYLHLEETSLKVGETAEFEVVLAPANAANKAYKLSLEGNKKAVKLNKRKDTITARKPGEVTLIATSKSGDLSWHVSVNVVE